MNNAHNPIQHNGTKPVEIDIYFIKDNFDRGLMVTSKVSIRLQMEIFTKGFPQIPRSCRQVMNDQYSFTNLRESVVSSGLLGKKYLQYL